MIRHTGYFDLCIPETCISQGNVEQTLKILYNLGYRTIAINQIIEDFNIEMKKKKKKRQPSDTLDAVPIPYNVDKVNDIAFNLGLVNFKVLNRLTIVFSSQDILPKITKSPNYKKFDLVAVQPTTLQTFMFTCSTFEADILTFDPENKYNIRLNRRLYNQLVDRGYHFELLYSPAIEDSTKRKNLIHVSHLYHSFGKSKNVFISSGAQNHMYFRSPYDIINLGFIFGLSEEKSKNAVTCCPNRVIYNSVGRRHGKAVMFVENIKDEHIVVDVSDNEDVVQDQPTQKKSKHAI
ncbi:hypothetical protein NQ317_017724 [Molorchus minor]|uniref:Uncharacterized protein n=1 Tax=Molorchus minor TaxID=1323400 RepID=A0ABQ9J6K8_9CUCU|nr:hypothetical protein NQ317_017724 [Molorchus minor]